MVATLILLWAPFSRADTVTSTANVSCNGKVTAFDGARLQLAARFAGGIEKLEIDRNSIKTVEFNHNDFNSQPARGPFYAHKPRNPALQKPAPKDETPPAGPRDVIYFISGDRMEADVLAVDGTAVRVSGNRSFPRVAVHSIRFASR